MKTKERRSHDLYDEPGVVGSLGGVAPYAKAQKISIAQVKKEFEKSFAYRLHKQGRWRGEFLPVVVFDIDEQWVTDLIKVQTLAKQNKGYRYILVVTDAFFKYAWAQSIKKETGKVWQIFLPRYSKKYKEGNPRRYRQIQAKNFTTWRFKSCYWTMGGGSYQSTDFSQAEQRVSLHLSGHWCLFQICVSSIH